ncbi:alpha-hydroxy acid oxidase [Jiella avicenniae]|uniref:Alpha-hydroxy-acid oxidizing protein n=1 Tax=Jiella avicenniae TaxID=2907202 RepID=A0A9X1P0G7_9HYPH|nr:alpha-hydroxy acid oxidase [Jiella avicenniae]MCE7027529.1 alpha-hydroxy-acid oxidizing protein [Jiella avicenniae]
MARSGGWGAGSRSDAASQALQRHPTYEFLEARAKRRIPRFAWDFVHGGTGADYGIDVNRRALDGVEIVPRYGVMGKAATETEIFGRRYSAPIGISPVGMDALAWPGSSRCLARAARDENIPYITGTLADSALEEVAEIAGPNAWLQLYGFPRDDHRVTFDMIARAEAAGMSAIVATLDAPVRAKRPRDLANRLVVPFRTRPSTVWQVATSPAWVRALMKAGMPGFGSIARYVDGEPTLDRVASFVQKELIGSFSWDEVSRMRRAFSRAVVVKGVLHPDDAERAVSAGVDAIMVSNHGGRQSDAAPAPIDVLPGIVDRVAGRAKILFDSGIRSGLDAARAIALGADAVFCGRAFLWGLGAAGDEGGAFVARMLREELAVAMAQSGAWTVPELREATIRHVGRFDFPARAAQSVPLAAQ